MILENKVAVVTAAASGIGRAGAVIMAREGAHVVIVDRDDASAKAVAAEIIDLGGKAEAIRSDVTDSPMMKDLIESVSGRLGRIDILHNHAGLQVSGDLEQVSPEGLDRSWNVNVRAQFVACRLVMPIMKAQGAGVILNTASNAGMFLDRGMLAYITTKSAVITMTKQIALDYARLGIRVNALCPGWVDTPFNAPYTAQLGGRNALERTVSATVPMGRFGLPSEVAEAILFLVSDRSSFVTGHALVVDGGECLASGINSVA